MSSAASDQQSLNHLDKCALRMGPDIQNIQRHSTWSPYTYLLSHCHIKIVSICDAFSSVHSVLHQFPECSNMAICCSKVRWSSSIASAQTPWNHTKPETKPAASPVSGQSLHLVRDCMVQREKCQPEATEWWRQIGRLKWSIDQIYEPFCHQGSFVSKGSS